MDDSGARAVVGSFEFEEDLVLGSRVPTTLKVFLLTLAIVDDIGAIAVIAIFYTDDLRLAYLGAAVGLVALVAVMRRLHMTYPPLYIVAGLPYCGSASSRLVCTPPSPAS